MIIDAHSHFGTCRVFDLEVTEELLLKKMTEAGVDAAVVQPFPGTPDVVKTHNEIAGLADKFPGKFFGLASVNPHSEEDFYRREVTRCIKDLGFVAIKLHTIGHAVSPLTRDGHRVFEMASGLAVPVMVHTGPGIPLSSPSLVIPLAREFPGLKIILGHAGSDILTAEAYVAAKECENIYLETSWCAAQALPWLVSELGSGRVMLGSDMPQNLPQEVAKYKAAHLSDEELADCLGRTAAKVYNLKFPE